jgi:hypothetical protein
VRPGNSVREQGSPGFFKLRVFAIVSSGIVVKEHELIPSIAVLVPEPLVMDGEVVTPNSMLRPQS